jgi:hypothetical protein
LLPSVYCRHGDKIEEGASAYGAIMGIFVGGYFSNRNEIAKKLNSAVASLM